MELDVCIAESDSKIWDTDFSALPDLYICVSLFGHSVVHLHISHSFIYEQQILSVSGHSRATGFVRP